MYNILKDHIEKNNIESFKAALNNSNFDAASLKQTGDLGNSLLHWAVHEGKIRFVKCLIARGADIALKNQDGDTVLHLASKLGHFDIVDELLGTSIAATERIKKHQWKDKDRSEKLKKIHLSEVKAVTLLNVENIQNETPLTLAAQLIDDAMYRKLLSFQPGYSKAHLDRAALHRKTQKDKEGASSFWSAFLESLCPAASLSELGESFFYGGLTTAVGTSIAFGVNATFSVIAVFGLGLMTFANFKKNQMDEDIDNEQEQSLIELSYINNIQKRLEFLAQLEHLSEADKHELQQIKEDLNKPITFDKKSQNKKAIQYITTQDKIYITLSTIGSFLCGYSGLLGVSGLALNIISGIAGVSIGASIVLGGPIGLGITLGIGLLFAASVALYHSHKLNKTYQEVAKKRLSLLELQETIYRTKKHLLHTNTLENINNLLGRDQETTNHIITLQHHDHSIKSSSTRSDPHNHAPGDFCEKEVRSLSVLGILKSTKNKATSTYKTIHHDPDVLSLDDRHFCCC